MGLSTFSTALAGLNSNTQGLNVVGNNLANLNTVGFKESNISFSEVLGQQFATPGTAESGMLNQVGNGSQVQAVRAVFTQGGIQASTNPLDVAIQGQGMLVVNDNGATSYTRAGNMHLDANGNLVSGSGANIQGYTADPATGAVNKSLGIQNIQMPQNLVSPTPTTQFSLAMNLDGQAPTGSNFSTSVQLFDSKGTAHMATLSMQKDISTDASPVTRWRFDLTIPKSEIAGSNPADTTSVSLLTGTTASDAPAAGAMVFDANGKMTSAYLGADPATNPAVGNLTVPPSTVTAPALANGASFSPITWKLLSDAGTPGVTGYASANEVTASNQNGAASGTMTGVSVQPDGMLAAVFSNGKTMNVGQIVLAQFNNLDGLISQGGGLYTESSASGEPKLGAPGEGSSGRLMSGALEQSNVDMATELTKIITFQRGYQANARLITTSDQILQETLNLKQ